MSHNVLPVSLRPQRASDVIGTYSRSLRTEEANGLHPHLTLKAPPRQEEFHWLRWCPSSARRANSPSCSCQPLTSLDGSHTAVRVNLLDYTNDYADLSGSFLPDTHRHNEGFTSHLGILEPSQVDS